jgi:hypothetical protein
MSLTLLQFVTAITSTGNQLMGSAARLAHVDDGDSVLVPNGWKLSRYIDLPIGQTLISVNTALSGISTGVVGLNAQLNAATVALQTADQVNVGLFNATGEALLTATQATVTPLLTSYITYLQIGAPIHAVTLLMALSGSIVNDGSPLVTMFNSLILCGMAQAVFAYTPQTSNDALDLLNQFILLFDATISFVSDLGASDVNWISVQQSLNSLRSNVLLYLQQQIAVEPSVMTQTFGDSLPDCVVCYALYGSLDQVDRLVAMNNPTFPLTMPTNVLYLCAYPFSTGKC